MNTYTIRLHCDNCGESPEVSIPKGIRVEDFKACPVCGCECLRRESKAPDYPTVPSYPGWPSYPAVPQWPLPPVWTDDRTQRDITPDRLWGLPFNWNHRDWSPYATVEECRQDFN